IVMLIVGAVLTLGAGIFVAGLVGGITSLVRALTSSGHLVTPEFIMAGSFLAFPVLALASVVVIGLSTGGKQSKTDEFKAHSRKTTGVITKVTDTGVTINDNPRVRLAVRYRLDSGAVAQTEQKMVVSRLSIPRPGDRVTVWYDPVKKETMVELEQPA